MLQLQGAFLFSIGKTLVHHSLLQQSGQASLSSQLAPAAIRLTAGFLRTALGRLVGQESIEGATSAAAVEAAGDAAGDQELAACQLLCALFPQWQSLVKRDRAALNDALAILLKSVKVLQPGWPAVAHRHGRSTYCYVSRTHLHFPVQAAGC